MIIGKLCIIVFNIRYLRVIKLAKIVINVQNEKIIIYYKRSINLSLILMHTHYLKILRPILTHRSQTDNFSIIRILLFDR